MKSLVGIHDSNGIPEKTTPRNMSELIRKGITMPVYRCSQLFEYGKYGWSESFYLTSGSHQLALNATQALSIPRKSFLSAECKITSIRVGDVAIKRDVLPFVYPGGGLEGNVSDPPDGPWTAQLINLRAGYEFSRKLWLRGLGDVWVRNTLLTTGGTKALSLLNQYLGTIIAQGFALRAYNRGPVTFDILSIANDGNGNAQVTTTAPHGFVNGNTVILRDCRQDPYFNGRWGITVTTPTSFLLKGGRLPRLLVALSGSVQLFVPTYPVINGVDILQIVKRDTGRPFGLSRGRQPSGHSRY